jgi:hypothetical protein
MHSESRNIYSLYVIDMWHVWGFPKVNNRKRVMMCRELTCGSSACGVVEILKTSIKKKFTIN